MKREEVSHDRRIKFLDALAVPMGWKGKVKCDHQQVRFQDKQYCLVGSLERAAISTHEQFEAFGDSYAHLYPDGKIFRYDMKIGTREDLEPL